ncbi:MAG: ABC transporter ATP-binding protein [Tissierellia bacterium]|nr:ABC transporter ATP-binding protein [Tissierellia bacterium]
MYLSVKNVHKSYGQGAYEQKVLNSVDLDIDKGERCLILGPSGSGKSTLLNVIGGLDSIDSGEISLDKLRIDNMSPKELVEYRRKNLGFVFQFYNLVPNLTVKENIEVCKYLSKESLNIEELLDILELSAHKNKYPAQISGGQQQRCSLARALVKNPALLLCDEPTGALDTKSSMNILKLLEDINEKYQTTMLIVSHNEAISKMCHKVLRIRDGKVESIIKNDNLVSALELEL